MRIVSLLPSATEIVCALGLGDQLVGVTHECDFPASVAALPKVTRSLVCATESSIEIDAMVRERARAKLPLFQLDVATLHALGPELIVTQGLCDVCAVDEAEVCAAAASMPGKPRIINLEPMSLGDVFESMRRVARAAGVADEGESAIEALLGRKKDVVDRCGDLPDRPSVVLLEWLDPLFGGGHWNPELVELAGGRELIGKAGARSRRIEFEELAVADPDVVFIACCGLSADRARGDLDRLSTGTRWRDLRAVKNGRVYVADGSVYFNRPGPRLVDSLEILAAALHPDASHRVTDEIRTHTIRVHSPAL